MTETASIDTTKLQLTMGNPNVQLRPAARTTELLKLTNLTSLLDNFDLSLAGQAVSWSTLSENTVNLFPNWSTPITLEVALPAEVRPGNYDLVITAASRSQPDISSSTRFFIEVLANPLIQNSNAATVSDHLTPASTGLQIGLEKPQLILAGGQNLTLPVTLHNLTSTSDTLQIQTSGMPEGWYKLSPDNLFLFAGWSETVTLDIVIPAGAAPGVYNGQLTVFAVNQPELHNAIPLRLEVPGLPPRPVYVPAAPINNSATVVPYPIFVEPVSTAPERTSWFNRKSKGQRKPAPATTFQPPIYETTPFQGEGLPQEIIFAEQSPTAALLENRPTNKLAVESKPQVIEEDQASRADVAGEAANQVNPWPDSYETTATNSEIKPAGIGIELRLETTDLTIVAGEFAEQQVNLSNFTALGDVFDLHIEGIPDSWYSLSCSSMTLFPHWSEEFYLRFDIPRQVEHGQFTARLFAISHSQPDKLAAAALVIQVLEPLWKDEDRHQDGLQPVLNLELARLELTLEKPVLNLLPGQTAEQQVSLVNESIPPGLFELSLEGLPPEWFNFSGTVLNLFPNWKEMVYLRITVPQDALPVTHIAQVRAISKSYPQIMAGLDLSLAVRTSLPAVKKAIILDQRPTEQLHKSEKASASQSEALLETIDHAHEIEVSGYVIEEPGIEAVADEIDDSYLAGNRFQSFQPTPAVPEQVGQSEVDFYTPNQTELTLENRPTNKLKLEDRQTNRLNSVGDVPPEPFITPFFSLQNVLPIASRSKAQPEAELTTGYTSFDNGITPATNLASSSPEIKPRTSLWQRVTGRGSSPTNEKAPLPAIYQPLQSPTAIELFKPVEPAGVAVKAPAAPRQSPPLQSDGTPRAHIALPKTRLTIVAGEAAELPISLANLTPLPDDFDLSVEGLPANWYSFSNDSVNMFPNWNESSAINIEIGVKVRPSLYTGRVIITARSQPGIRGEAPIEIEVLSPLKVEARVHPRRVRGFKAKYGVTIRNRSMCDAVLNLQLTPENPYCAGQFSPAPVLVAAGGTTTVKLRVNIKPKTPKEQAQQLQTFQVKVEPTFQVAGQPVTTPELLAEAEYLHESRWSFIGKHPILFGFAVFVLLVVVFWSVVVLKTIQGGFIALTDKVTYQGTPRGVLRVEQKTFSDTLQNNINPFSAFTQLQVQFQEENQRVVISMRGLFISSEIKGQLGVNPINGDLLFISEKKGQEDSLPWLFAPPDMAVDKISSKLKRLLISQNPPQRLESALIEGNTLFLKIKACVVKDPACT